MIKLITDRFSEIGSLPFDALMSRFKIGLLGYLHSPFLARMHPCFCVYQWMHAWLSFHMGLPFWGDICFVFLLNMLVTHDTQPHTEKYMFNILIGYPQARMCVWAKQEESYFWSCIVALAYLCLSAQVNSCCGVFAADAGLKLLLGNVLNINLVPFHSEFCLSKLCFHSL